MFSLAITFFCIGLILSFEPKSDLPLGNLHNQNLPTNIRDFPHFPLKVVDGEQNYLKTFLCILMKNSLVGVSLCIGGLISAGIITAILMVWNGYLLGIIMNMVLSSGVTIYRLTFTFITYGPIEVLAMAWLGAIGLRGSIIMIDFIRENKINKNNIPSLWEIGLPFVFLSIAAFFETTVIYYLQS